MRFEQYKVVISGVNNAVGHAAAKLFLDEGATVIGIAKAFDENMDQRIIRCECDVSKAEDIAKACAFVSETFSAAVDTFINAVGVTSVGTPVAFEDKEYEEIMNVLVRAPMFFARGLYPMLAKAPQSNASIVNVASVLAFSNNPASFLYNVANTALVRFTKTAANAFKGVRCNTVCPGYVNDDLLTRDNKHSAEEAKQILDMAIAVAPAHRLSEPEEIAEAIAFMASTDAEYSTGSDLLIDGGISTRIM